MNPYTHPDGLGTGPLKPSRVLAIGELAVSRGKFVGPCATCGQAYVRRRDRPGKYCSRRCKGLDALVLLPAAVCPCGAVIPARRRGAYKGVAPRYCSRACAGGNLPRRTVARPRCVACGVETGGAKFCSEPHRTDWRIAKWMVGDQVNKPKGAPRAKRYTCEACGRTAEKSGKGNLPKFCSDACRGPERIARRAYEAKRGGGHRRRARKYGTARASYRKLDVFKAAGWKCQRCDDVTPIWFMGMAHSKAPELDHIWPISRGGADARFNVQLLCRECNNAKGDSAYLTDSEVARLIAAADSVAVEGDSVVATYQHIVMHYHPAAA